MSASIYRNQLLTNQRKVGAPALEFARPFLRIRGLAFLPSVISIVGFSAFRGKALVVEPKVNNNCQLILDCDDRTT